ncbi:nucleotidyltransferase AbiEii toxin of type IV toxin-antitoxin system [Herbihabitans rhizosphaerae]|uniref:Nucleotidyltransferase AbiEii toxin of type IV toxin-antitoxin system n=1 Tax=Herbihabitans rhizosphaerae TaxID=1872711 RepID=A0A4Q7L295_9PSEU|nr:nucleotidyl transferase AbiEii/AbiGii toxin family protein [Herbihabitans rhizosphaerae]RZS43659.1 nucleotidyltransferase AbiEii toxin of type IV toxin-antitoxin system [Herbihabitans rhizosphaerae]
MNLLAQALQSAAALLDRQQRHWALVGGLAVSARSIPRFTSDVDLAVAVADDKTAEELVRSFAATGFRLSALVEQEAADRLATARLESTTANDDEVLVDLLFASSGIEAEIVAAAERVAIFPELTVPVATRGHLIAVKVLSQDDDARQQDLIDLRNLLAVATDEDLRLARESVQLITARGFNRERELAVDLEAFVKRMR